MNRPSPRSPELCPWRQPVEGKEARDLKARCDFVGRVQGLGSVEVTRATCEECCRSTDLPEDWNPVVASLVYAAAGRALESGDIGATRRANLIEARQFAATRLTTVGSDGRVAERFTTREGGRPGRSGLSASWPRIGLIGRNSAAGLGSINRDLASRLPIRSWLVPRFGAGINDSPPEDAPCPWELLDRPPSRRTLTQWLEEIDVLLFVETPYLQGLPKLARQVGIQVVCVPMWEWLHPGIEWLREVDRMICPTRWTHRRLTRWSEQFGFGYQTVLFPWPIDCERFRFRRRDRFRQIVFINGTGGAGCVDLEGRRLSGGRKNAELLAQVARLIPEIPIRFFSQSEQLPTLPANVRVLPPTATNDDLYAEGDVCLVLSRWEGLGLQSLECQAAGMPLVAPDHPPMDEPAPWSLLPVRGERVVRISPERAICIPEFSPHAVAEQLRQAFDSDIRKASESARRYVLEHHDWNRATPTILSLLSGTTAEGGT